MFGVILSCWTGGTKTEILTFVENYPLVINVGADLFTRRCSPPAKKTEVNEPTGWMIYDKLALLLEAL